MQSHRPASWLLGGWAHVCKQNSQNKTVVDSTHTWHQWINVIIILQDYSTRDFFVYFFFSWYFFNSLLQVTLLSVLGLIWPRLFKLIFLKTFLHDKLLWMNLVISLQFPTTQDQASVVMGEISPHQDDRCYESNPSTSTPSSYSKLNYNETMQRYCTIKAGEREKGSTFSHTLCHFVCATLILVYLFAFN